MTLLGINANGVFHDVHKNDIDNHTDSSVH